MFFLAAILSAASRRSAATTACSYLPLRSRPQRTRGALMSVLSNDGKANADASAADATFADQAFVEDALKNNDAQLS